MDYEAKDAKDFLASLQQKGEKVSFALAGLGTGSHLCGLMLTQAHAKKLAAELTRLREVVQKANLSIE